MDLPIRDGMMLVETASHALLPDVMKRFKASMSAAMTLISTGYLKKEFSIDYRNKNADIVKPVTYFISINEVLFPLLPNEDGIIVKKSYYLN